MTLPHSALLGLQEQVAECRELNSTEVWLAVASTVNPLCQSMPLLLHHQVNTVRQYMQVSTSMQANVPSLARHSHMQTCTCIHHLIWHQVTLLVKFCCTCMCGVMKGTDRQAGVIPTHCMQEQIVDILLQAVKVEAAISLPPILHVLSCLARDLQQDFLPYLPRVFTTATNLVNSGVKLTLEHQTVSLATRCLLIAWSTMQAQRVKLLNHQRYG